MPASRELRRVAWLAAAGVAAVALGTGALRALVSRGDGPGPATGGVAASPDLAPGSGGPGGDWARLAEALRQLKQGAGDPQVMAARTNAVEALAAAPDPRAQVMLALLAVEADPAPAEEDPLWSDLVRGLSDLWTGDTLSWGLGLMLAESRPKARRAVISSLALLASSDRSGALTAEQRRGLTTNFVDVFPQLPAGQQPEVLAALRNVGGNDIADILAGKDLSSDDLEIHREYKQALAEGAGARQALAQLEAPAPAAAPSPAALPPATPAEIEPPPSAPAAQPTDDDRPPGN